MSKIEPIKEYTIQTTAYRGGEVVKDVKVCYERVTEWVNRYELVEVIHNMTSLKNSENKA